MDTCLLLSRGVGSWMRVGQWLGATLCVVSYIIASSWCPVAESLAGGDRWTHSFLQYPQWSQRHHVFRLRTLKFEMTSGCLFTISQSRGLLLENHGWSRATDRIQGGKKGWGILLQSTSWVAFLEGITEPVEAVIIFYVRSMGSGEMICAGSLPLVETFILSVS